MNDLTSNARMTNCWVLVAVSSSSALVRGQSSAVVMTEMLWRMEEGEPELLPTHPRTSRPSRIPYIAYIALR